MSALLNTAITGIRLNQAAMSVTGHNIVNANTEGYSRQSIVQSTNSPLRTAAGYIGTGVSLDEIIRHSEKYLVDQVVRDIGGLSEADSYLVNVSQINNLLAADQTNLANYMNNFFDSVNQAINDPGSLLGRQLLLTQSEQLVAGFQAVQARLLAQNEAVNKQLQGAADNVTALGKEIAQLNSVIGEAGSVGGAPNDLLDKMDLLVRELGRYVSVSTVARSDGGLDVFIGQGQPLVVGNATQTLRAVPGNPDASRFDIIFETKAGAQIANRLITGGELGGLLRFRNDALQPAIASLGLLATSIAASANAQNRLGMDMENSLGGNIFTDVNNPRVAASRVSASLSNMPPNDRALTVTIESLNDLKASDYELSFPGPDKKFEIRRLSDNTVVHSGLLSATPQSVSVDGFSVNFESGSFQRGDRFLLKPVSNGATDFNVQIRRAEEFAFASPITVRTGDNEGGAQIIGTRVDSVDTDFFSRQGALEPPLVIRFTSATTYDVLDNSDPANPQQLDPPLRNLRFTPGARNDLLPDVPGGLTLVTGGPAIGVVQLGQTTNGYPSERLRFQTTDPATGFIRDQSVDLGANTSAAQRALLLSSLNGVQATAYTETVLDNFQIGSGGPLQLELNGQNLTDPNWIAPGASAPVPLPSPVTAEALAERINSNYELQQQGIVATVEGGSLRLFASSGVDLQFAVGGSGSLQADGVSVRDVDDPDTTFTIGGTLQMQLPADTEVTSNRNDGMIGVFAQPRENYLGIQISMTSGSGAAGQPKAGDTFVVSYNTNGTADNRNGLELLGLNSKGLLGGNNQTLQDVYGQLAEKVGILTNQARINQSAGESMLRQSMDAVQSVSGVNLEEEAARLIMLEQHYNASARLITLARDLFETLLRI